MSEDLLLYAQLGYADHIKRLVSEGVDPDWRREDGVTTLMIAALTGRTGIMEALIDAGATVDLQAPDGMTALLAATAFARTTREIAAIELLLARGAEPNVANFEGNDALMMTARHGLVEAVIVLLKAGANPCHANRFGTTALMQASRGHLVETVRVLIRAGANRAQVDERGLNAAKYARELGEPPAELVAMLAPSELGPASDISRQTCRFDHDHFKISIIGAWGENESDGVWEFTESTGERQITVAATLLPAELDPDERHDALARRIREQEAQLRTETEQEMRFSEARYADSGDTIQARFNGTSVDGRFFVAVCVYAAPEKFVTLAYRDFRPGLSDEVRGRQASESVASFRVK